MARLLFGGDDVSVRGAAGTAVLSASGGPVTVYSDANCTTLADIQTTGGVTIAGSVLTDTDYSELPEFLGPAGNVGVLYVKANGGPPTRIEARASEQVAVETSRATAAEAAAINTAETFATGAVGTETSRAMAAEATKLVAGSTSGYANLAALPAASAHTHELVKTDDGAVYESTGSAWVQLVAPNGTYALALTRTAVKTANYTAAAGDLVPVDTTAGAVTITLPTAPADRTRLAVKHIIQGGTNAVTVARGGTDVFNKTGGSTSLAMPLVNQALFLEYNAANGIWTVLADDLPLGGLDLRYASVVGSDAWLKLYASELDAIITGAVTRDGNGAATAATVTWPDGSTGAYTATTVNSSFPGAVDAYTVTWVGPTATKTVTQPAVTRSSSTGAVTNRPAMTVA